MGALPRVRRALAHQVPRATPPPSAASAPTGRHWHRTANSATCNPSTRGADPKTDDAVEVLKEWTYHGSGYKTQAERDLALATAARTREYRAAERAERAATPRKRP